MMGDSFIYHDPEEDAETVEFKEGGINEEDELLSLLEDYKRKDATTNLMGVRHWLQNKQDIKDPEFHLGVATSMAINGLLQAVTRSEGKRQKGVDLMGTLFGIWGSPEAEEYFRNHIKEREEGFAAEGRSWLTKSSSLEAHLVRLANALDKTGRGVKADLVDGLIKKYAKNCEENFLDLFDKVYDKEEFISFSEEDEASDEEVDKEEHS